MISETIFGQEITELAAWFKVEKLTPKVSKTIYKFLDASLTDEELIQACEWAICHQPINYGMPTAAHLVESVHGTIQERAIVQLDNLDRLSPVGRKAFDAIGGVWAKENSDRPELWRKEFIAQYCAFAKKAPLSDLVMPVAKIALDPAKEEISENPDLEIEQLKADLARLNAVLRFGVGKKEAIAEAQELGLTFLEDAKGDISGFALPGEEMTDVTDLLYSFGAWKSVNLPNSVPKIAITNMGGRSPTSALAGKQL